MDMSDSTRTWAAGLCGPLPQAHFADVGQALADLPTAPALPGAVDVLLVNPPAPDGGIWIRSQHRVGRRSRENMIWPQVSLAQLAALLQPDYSVEIIDAIPQRMTWEEFERLLTEKRPRYYVTQVTAPTLTNDMRGTFLARAWGREPSPLAPTSRRCRCRRWRAFPTLDYVLARRAGADPARADRHAGSGGMAQDTVQGDSTPIWAGGWQKLFTEADPDWQAPWSTAIRRPVRSTGPRLRSKAWSGAMPTVGSTSMPTGPSSATWTTCPAAASPAALGQVPGAEHQGTVHVHRPQPGLPGGLHVLHQTRQLPVLGACSLAGECPGRSSSCCGTWGCATCTCTPTCSRSTASR